MTISRRSGSQEEHDSALLQGVALMTRLLLTEPDLALALRQALAILGEAEGADRAYLFRDHVEPSSGRLLMSQECEWTNGMVGAQIGNPELQDLPYDTLTPELESRFAQGRPFSAFVEDLDTKSQRLLREQGILSVLLLPVLVGDRPWGFLGFDACRDRRIWEEREMTILRTAADAIGAAIGRHRAEAASRETAAQLQLLIDNAQDLICRHRADGTLLFVSPASLALLGFPPEAMLGKDSKEWVHPEDVAGVVAVIKEAIRGGKSSYRVEHRLRRADGIYVWVETLGRLHFEGAGRLREIQAAVRPVEERKRAEAELLRQNRELTALNEIGQALNRLADPAEIAELIFSHFNGLLDDRNLYIALHDPAKESIHFQVYTIDGERRAPFGRKLGNGLTEHVLRTREPLVINHDCSGCADRMGLAAFGRPCRSFLGVPMISNEQVEGVIALQDYEREGAYEDRHLRLLTTIAAQAAGALCNARLYSQARRELAERQRVEAALRQTQEDLERAQAVGHVGSWFSDSAGGKNLQWSAETCRIFGVTPEAFDGRVQSFFDRVHPDDLEAVRSARERALSGLMAYDLQHRIIRPDGMVRWVQERAVVEAASEEVGGGTRLVGVVQDITERRLLEDQLRQSQKLESIGQLAAGVAHDFNNILTVITGNAALLQIDMEHQPDSTGLLTEILAASERAANLTRQLLLFSRKQQLQPQAVDLNQLSSNLTKMLSRMLGEDVILEFSYETGLPVVTADPSMMEQAIMNLAVNARDAMPRGGRLQIATSAHTFGPDVTQRHPEARPGCFVCLAVGDNGEGIPPSIRERIFEPFFTTKEVGKGTGLGLATVYGIVQQHRGWIAVDSEVGRGTTFRIFLPASPIAPAEAGDARLADLEPARGETILFVEDEAPVRALITRILTRHGYRVVSAGSGPEACRIPEAQLRGADLLLTDMVMPGDMTGRELARVLRSIHPGLRVIYYSGYSMELTLGKVSFQAGDAFLQKPCTPRQLLLAVQTALRRDDSVSPRINTNKQQ